MSAYDIFKEALDRASDPHNPPSISTLSPRGDLESQHPEMRDSAQDRVGLLMSPTTSPFPPPNSPDHEPVEMLQNLESTVWNGHLETSVRADESGTSRGGALPNYVDPHEASRQSKSRLLETQQMPDFLHDRLTSTQTWLHTDGFAGEPPQTRAAEIDDLFSDVDSTDPEGTHPTAIDPPDSEDAPLTSQGDVENNREMSTERGLGQFHISGDKFLFQGSTLETIPQEYNLGHSFTSQLEENLEVPSDSEAGSEEMKISPIETGWGEQYTMTGARPPSPHHGSPTESQLVTEGFEFHNELPEDTQITKFGDKAFRKALREISPELPRKKQWYAWNKVKQMLESSPRKDEGSYELPDWTAVDEEQEVGDWTAGGEEESNIPFLEPADDTPYDRLPGAPNYDNYDCGCSGDPLGCVCHGAPFCGCPSHANRRAEYGEPTLKEKKELPAEAFKNDAALHPALHALPLQTQLEWVCNYDCTCRCGFYCKCRGRCMCDGQEGNYYGELRDKEIDGENQRLREQFPRFFNPKATPFSWVVAKIAAEKHAQKIGETGVPANETSSNSQYAGLPLVNESQSNQQGSKPSVPPFSTAPSPESSGGEYEPDKWMSSCTAGIDFIPVPSQVVRPDTPRPADPSIRQSVEPETPVHLFHRESTPAYEARSPTPSPASHVGVDVEMHEAPPPVPKAPHHLRPMSSPDPISSPLHTVTAPETPLSPSSTVQPPTRARSQSPSKIAAPGTPSLLKPGKRGDKTRRKSTVQGAKVEKAGTKSRNVTQKVANSGRKVTEKVKKESIRVAEAVAKIEATVRKESAGTPTRRSERIRKQNGP